MGVMTHLLCVKKHATKIYCDLVNPMFPKKAVLENCSTFWANNGHFGNRTVVAMPAWKCLKLIETCNIHFRIFLN